jgi:hypothetical protein
MSNTSEHELLKYIYLLLWWVIFALLNPESESGSGSTEPIESGSGSATLGALKEHMNF